MYSPIITLNIYSGRPNPRWVLSEEQTAELRERLSAAADNLTADAPPGSLQGLGYRGFEVRLHDDAPPLHVHGGVVGTPGVSANLADDGRELERFLLGTIDLAGGAPRGLNAAASGALSESVREHIAENLAVPPASFARTLKASYGGCPPCVAALAPPYDPGKWNNVPSVQYNNNCYNYANNLITNSFAQPGRGSGRMYTSLTCGSVQPAAQRDGLTASANFSTTISNGFYCALVIWPNEDFHWYRQDSGGCWSHKPGSTQARNTDNSGNPITDPKTCNRGPYTDFCSYMITYPGKVTIY
ncbi:MAG TPA: hypothetical protein VEK57_25435 [Thermoanaerobaculia bacterium]|nr:hypothetical protein [Thermoanaerobaculia bacterium]